MKKLFLFILLFQFANISFGQNGTCINYFTGNEVYSIAEGKNSMWFATECKIVKMDKNSKKIEFLVHLPKTECYSYWTKNLFVDSLDNLWLSGSSGLFKFDGNIWNKIDNPKRVKFLNIDRKKNIWFFGDSITKYNGIGFTKFPIEGYSINDMVFDYDNSLWFANPNGLSKFNDTIEKNYNKSNSNLPGNNLLSIAIDTSKNFWIAGEWISDSFPIYKYSPFVAKFDGINWKIYKDSTTKLFGLGQIKNIEVDKEQNIWCQGSLGLAKFDGTSWILEYSVPKESNSIELSSFLIDRSGNKWLGTRGLGVLRHDGAKWFTANLSNSGLSGNSVNAIAFEKNGTLWAGTLQASPNYYNENTGVVRFDGTNWKNNFDPNSQSPIHGDAVVTDHNGNIWVANSNSLYKYDGNNWSKFPVDLYGNYISMVVDSSNHIWVASNYRNLKEFNGSDWKEHKYGGGSNLKFIDVDLNNNIWFGTYNELSRYNGSDWKEFFCKDKSGGTCWFTIQAIKSDLKNNIWIGGGGLTKFDGLNYTRYKTKKNGLAYHNVTRIEIDNENNAWVGTSSDGLLKYNGKVWVLYDTSNSEILSNYIRVIKSDGNQIWIGSESGLTKFNECGGDTINVTTETITEVKELNYQSGSVSVYPNPFNSTLNINYNLPENSQFKFKIMDVKGLLIKTVEGKADLGNGQLNLEVEGIYEGIYFGLFETEHGTFQIKLIKIR